MRRILLAASLIAMTAPAFAGGMVEPTMEPEVIAAATSSSSAGIIVPLLLLLLVAAAVAGSSDGSDVVIDG